MRQSALLISLLSTYVLGAACTRPPEPMNRNPRVTENPKDGAEGSPGKPRVNGSQRGARQKPNDQKNRNQRVPSQPSGTPPDIPADEENPASEHPNLSDGGEEEGGDSKVRDNLPPEDQRGRSGEPQTQPSLDRPPSSNGGNYPPAGSGEAGAGELRKRLIGWYGQKTNYDQVGKDVLKFYSQGRKNGCVAYLSTALRHVGIEIPIAAEPGSKESPSLLTKPFAAYLKDKLHWKVLTDPNYLQPGDVVFTKDDVKHPGYPAHTYVFASWSNIALGRAMVIDNQDFTHERNIYDSDPNFNFMPFAFAVRPH